MWSGPYHLGRTDVNASDVFCALNNLGTTFSQVLQDAENFEIPFCPHSAPKTSYQTLTQGAVFRGVLRDSFGEAQEG